MKKKTLFIALMVIVSIGLVFIPSFVKKTNMINYLCMIFLYIALASSWNILGGYTGQISLGHSAFFGLGALATRMLWFAGWHIIPSLIIGGIVAMLFAFLIGFPAFKLKGVYFTIGTLALSQILYATVGNIFPTISSLPLEELKSYSLTPRYFLFLAIAFLTVLVSYLLTSSSFGLGMKAVREEEDAAETLGVNAFRHKLVALLLSAFFSGLAGGAFAFFHVGYYPQYPFDPIWSLDAQMMVFIGGTGTVLGPIIGAVFFVVLEEILSLKLAEFHLTVFGTLFILVVLFLPRGLAGLWSKFQKVQIGKLRKKKSNEVL